MVFRSQFWRITALGDITTAPLYARRPGLFDYRRENWFAIQLYHGYKVNSIDYSRYTIYSLFANIPIVVIFYDNIVIVTLGLHYSSLVILWSVSVGLHLFNMTVSRRGRAAASPSERERGRLLLLRVWNCKSIFTSLPLIIELFMCNPALIFIAGLE